MTPPPHRPPETRALTFAEPCGGGRRIYIRRLRYAVQHTTPPSLTPNTFYLLNEYVIKLRRWRRSARDAMYGRRHCSGVSRAKIISRSFSFRCQPLGEVAARCYGTIGNASYCANRETRAQYALFYLHRAPHNSTSAT